MPETKTSKRVFFFGSICLTFIAGLVLYFVSAPHASADTGIGSVLGGSGFNYESAGPHENVDEGYGLTGVGYGSDDHKCTIYLMTAPVLPGGRVDFNARDPNFFTTPPTVCSSGQGDDGPYNNPARRAEYLNGSQHIAIGWSWGANTSGGKPGDDSSPTDECFYQEYAPLDNINSRSGWGATKDGSCSERQYQPGWLYAVARAPAGRVIIGIAFSLAQDADVDTINMTTRHVYKPGIDFVKDTPFTQPHHPGNAVIQDRPGNEIDKLQYIVTAAAPNSLLTLQKSNQGAGSWNFLGSGTTDGSGNWTSSIFGVPDGGEGCYDVRALVAGIGSNVITYCEQDFNITANPISIQAGQNGTLQVNFSPAGGYSGTPTYTVTNCGSYSWLTCSGLVLTVAAGTSAQTVSLDILGDDDTHERTTTTNLTVSAGPPPSTPTGLSANTSCNGSNPQIGLTWNSVSGATGYRLYRNGSQIYDGAGASFTDTNVTTGTSYSYEITAYNSNGESTRSTVVSATAPNCAGQTGQISHSPAGNYTICQSGTGSPTSVSVTISWNTSPALGTAQATSELNGGGEGVVGNGASGSQNYPSLSSAGTYTLRLRQSPGGSILATDSFTITSNNCSAGTGTIQGRVQHDDNGDGNYSEGFVYNSGLSGCSNLPLVSSISITGAGNASTSLNRCDPNGFYQVLNLPLGSYTVTYTLSASAISAGWQIVGSSSKPASLPSNGSVADVWFEIKKLAAGALLCTGSPANPVTGQIVTFTASGGNGTYTWTALGGSPNNGSGNPFTTSYSTTGSKTVTVTSNGINSPCSVTVGSAPPGSPGFRIAPISQTCSTSATVTFFAEYSSDPGGGIGYSVVSSASWSSDFPSIASKSGPVSEGIYNCNSPGTTPIRATYLGLTAAANIQVTNITVSLAANPNSGAPPLATILTANVGGSASGPINYNFWWNCSNTTDNVGQAESACGALPPPTPLDITVRARGTPGQGIFPLMSLRVGTILAGNQTLTNSFQNYSFSITNPPDIQEALNNIANGVQVSLANGNYYANPGNDRDIIVDYIIINGQTIQTESPSVLTVIDRGNDIYASSEPGCEPPDSSARQTETLNCRGYLQFPLQMSAFCAQNAVGMRCNNIPQDSLTVSHTYATARATPFKAKVIAARGSSSDQEQADVTVTGGEFSLNASPNSCNIPIGRSCSQTIRIYATCEAPFNGPIDNLGVSGQPSGVTPSLTRSRLANCGQDATLSISTGAGAPTGSSFPLTISGDGDIDASGAIGPGETQSAIVTVTIQAIPPAAPSNLLLSNSTCERIALTWQDNSDDETSFRIYRSASSNPSFPSSYSQIATRNPNVRNYTDTPPNFNQSYHYAVTAIGLGGESAAATRGPVFNKECRPDLTLSLKGIDEVNSRTYDQSTNIANGDTITFRITISNQGPLATSDALRVYVEDTLSANLTYVPGSAEITRPPGQNGRRSVSASQNGQVITFDVGRNLGDKPADNRNWILYFDATLESTVVKTVDFFKNSALIFYSGPRGPLAPASVTTGLVPVFTGRVRIPQIREIAP